MTSDVRRKALSLLDEVWSLSPDVRLGQLMAHLGFLSEVHVDRGLGDVDDDELMALLERHKEELAARAEGEQIFTLPPTGPTVATSGSPIGLNVNLL